MPPRGLPGNANLEQLKKGAKSFQRAVRAGDAGAAEVVREFHPRLPDAQPGSPELNGFTRTDAQLVVARQFGFSSWPKLKAHLELVARYARSPHEQPVGGPLTDEQAVVDEFLRLACLTYGDDDPDRFRRAQSLLEEHDWLARASIHTIAATGEVDAARELLDRDPSQASLVGGPHGWEPLLYLTYSRVPLGAGPLGGRGRATAAGARRRPERRLSVGGADPAVHRADRRAGRRRHHPEAPGGARARAAAVGGRRRRERWAGALQPGWGPGPAGGLARAAVRVRAGHRRRRPVAPAARRAAGLTPEDARGPADRRGRSRAHRPGPRGCSPAGWIPRAARPSTRSTRDARRSRRRHSTGTWTSCPLLVDAGASWEHDQVDELVATAMAGDRDDGGAAAGGRSRPAPARDRAVPRPAGPRGRAEQL